MNWEVRLTKEAQKELNRIPAFYQTKIILAFQCLAQDPFSGKKLNGKLSGLYTYRVWPYRIIYKLYKNQLLIIIIHITHRQGAYKR